MTMRTSANADTGMPTLNLPVAELTVRERDGRMRVFCPLRQRFVTLTPEEWVRQHFVAFLVRYKGYPAALMGNELSLTAGTGGGRKRCDTVVFDTVARPRMIVEYKAPHVPITQRVFDQIARYNAALRADYLVVSNGMKHYCCRMDYAKGGYAFMQNIPAYGEL